MKLTAAQVQQIMFALRCTAERDPSDRIANAASQLAFELETPVRVASLTELDRHLIRYAVRKAYRPLRGAA
jgi:hypothetical protein